MAEKYTKVKDLSVNDAVAIVKSGADVVGISKDVPNIVDVDGAKQVGIETETKVTLLIKEEDQ